MTYSNLSSNECLAVSGASLAGTKDAVIPPENAAADDDVVESDVEGGDDDDGGDVDGGGGGAAKVRDHSSAYQRSNRRNKLTAARASGKTVGRGDRSSSPDQRSYWMSEI